MTQFVVAATASETLPDPNDQLHVRSLFVRGRISIQAAGTGTGTWSGILNVAPVSASGVFGTIVQYPISNSAPLAEDTKDTGMSTFAMWWTSVSGTCSLKGSIDG